MHPTFPLLAVTDFPRIHRGTIDTLQVNPGYRFNRLFTIANMPIASVGQPRLHLRDATAAMLAGGVIRVAGHCYGCTAGQGPSCGGALAEGRTDAASCTPEVDVNHQARAPTTGGPARRGMAGAGR